MASDLTPKKPKKEPLDTKGFIHGTSLSKGNRHGTFLKEKKEDLTEFRAQLNTVFEKEFKRPAKTDRDKNLRQVHADINSGDMSSNIKDETAGPKFRLSNQEVEWMLHQPEQRWMDYLAYRYQFKVYPRLRKLTDFPVHLLIEPTSVCNLRCVMCFQVDSSFTKKEFMGHMPWDLFLKVADQAKEHHCRAVTLASRGEPTLHPRFGEMLLHLRDIGIMDLKINTNATRLTEKLTDDILSAGVNEVVFSVDAGTKDTYESIRVNGKFDDVVANIERFNNVRAKKFSKSPTITRISGVKVRDDQDEEQMADFWEKHVDQVTIKRAMPRWDSYNNPPIEVNQPCSALWERMYVWYDGKVNPCDFDYKSYLSTGDANTTSLSDIWLGAAYQKLRDEHVANMRKKIVPCDRCPIF
jgi:radical SAM protein with 4Fe4S-binding SPASM domain